MHRVENTTLAVDNFTSVCLVIFASCVLLKGEVIANRVMARTYAS
jgi:hypothetical protein